jgi:uncharacterized SAM-binding protein YcdF (DUF218 family)
MLNSLVSPLRFGVLLAIALVFAWRWLPRWLRAVAVVPLLVCAMLSLPLFANGLVLFEESRAAANRICEVPLPRTIVVLAGGTSKEPSGDADYATLTEASLRRLFAAVDLQRKQPDAQLVISGGAAKYTIAESTLMGRLAEQLGVPAASMRLETESRSTWQNAQFVAALQPAVERRIWLVTSALHMPRSVYAFEQAGFEVCAASTDSRYARSNGFGYFLPSTSALLKADAALHEIVGEIAYRWGWLRSTSRDPWSASDEH